MRLFSFISALVAASLVMMANVFNGRADRIIDDALGSINCFRQQSLYNNKDTGVTLDALNSADSDITQVTELNRNNQTLIDAVRYYIAAVHVHNKHGDLISKVSEAVNVHELFRHMFGMKPAMAA